MADESVLRKRKKQVIDENPRKKKKPGLTADCLIQLCKDSKKYDVDVLLQFQPEEYLMETALGDFALNTLCSNRFLPWIAPILSQFKCKDFGKTSRRGNFPLNHLCERNSYFDLKPWFKIYNFPKRMILQQSNENTSPLIWLCSNNEYEQISDLVNKFTKAEFCPSLSSLQLSGIIQPLCTIREICQYCDFTHVEAYLQHFSIDLLDFFPYLASGSVIRNASMSMRPIIAYTLLSIDSERIYERLTALASCNADSLGLCIKSGLGFQLHHLASACINNSPELMNLFDSDGSTREADVFSMLFFGFSVY